MEHKARWKGRWALWLAVAIGLALVGRVLARAGPSGVTPAGSSPGTVLSLPAATVAPGGQVEVALSLSGATAPVYSVEVVLAYDPAVVTATAAAKGSLVSAWSMASNLSTAGEVRLALASAQPVSGSGEVAVLTFAAIGDEGTATDLAFLRGELNEGAIAVAFQNGRIRVTAAPCYDLDGDGVVGASDIQLLTARWRQRTGDPGWDSRFDLDGDGVITVADVMRVAAAWGNRCP